MTWTKLPPIPAFTHCGSCPPKPEVLPHGAPLAVGFGVVEVTRGEEVVWSGDDENVLLLGFEAHAAQDPDHDWRVTFDAPLYNATYQRQDGEWVLVEKGAGFA